MHAESSPQKFCGQVQENGLRAVQGDVPLQNHLEQPDYRHCGGGTTKWKFHHSGVLVERRHQNFLHHQY